MGRKRDKGKARRKAAEEAKAKEREEQRQRVRLLQEERFQQALATQFKKNDEEYRQLMLAEAAICKHGFDSKKIDNNDCVQFVKAFKAAWEDAVCADEEGDGGELLYLTSAKDDTMDKFAHVWDDTAKLKMAISYCLSKGTQDLLDGKLLSHNDARENAACVRYFQQHIVVELKRTQALFNWPKICDASHADEHTLVKFFRKRISCSCLDEKYEEVKHITKKGICSNEECSTQSRWVDRSRTKYCSRCRCVAYCSRACQEAHWSEHKTDCDVYAATIAKFEAKQQNCCSE